MKKSLLATVISGFFNIANCGAPHTVKHWLTWEVTHGPRDHDHWFETFGFEKGFYMNATTDEVKQAPPCRSIIESIAYPGVWVKVRPVCGPINKLPPKCEYFYRRLKLLELSGY